MRQRKGCNWQMSDSCLSSCPGCVNQWYGPGSSLCWRWTFYFRALKMACKKQSIGSFGPRAFISVQLCISYVADRGSWTKMSYGSFHIPYTVKFSREQIGHLQIFCGKGFADWRFQLFAGTAHAAFVSTSCSAAHFPISAFRSGVGSSCFHSLELTCFTSHWQLLWQSKELPSKADLVAIPWLQKYGNIVDKYMERELWTICSHVALREGNITVKPPCCIGETLAGYITC